MSAGLSLSRLQDHRSSVRRRALTHALLGVLPVLLTLDFMHYMVHHGHIQAWDFHYEFWPASQRVLHGLSPYARGWMNIPGSISFPYPALTAVAMVPFALFNHALGDWIFTGLNIAAALLTLRVLSVRDWRLYGLTLLLWPVILAWQTANITLLLALGIACLWRWREEPIVAGLLVAVMVSLKPTFIWPVALWLLATRRYRALACAAAGALILNLFAWTIVGFDQIHAYLALDSAVNSVMDRRGYGIFSIVMHLGGSRALAYALGIAAAAGVAVACFVAGRRGHARAALTLAVATCLLATPVLWGNYFALLIVPLALYRPRLDPLWLLPLAMVGIPEGKPAGWQIAVALTVSTIVLWGLLRLREPRSPAVLAPVAPPPSARLASSLES